MRVAILSIGSVVVEQDGRAFLFGAPDGTGAALKEAGIEVPKYCFTTSLKSPGFGSLGAASVRFKEQALRLEGFIAEPVRHKHGTDYSVQADGAKLLFSERGDVAAADVVGYDLAVIRNKHRSDEFGPTVITWPWPSSEYSLADGSVMEVSTKVWSSMDDVPGNLKKLNGAPLTLEQANFIARVAIAAGSEGNEKWPIGIAQFKKTYVKKDGAWQKREKAMDQLSQDKAGYVDNAGKNAGIRVCANCEHYCQNMTCCMVEGDINPAGVCVLWEYGCEMEEEKQPMPPDMPPEYIASQYAYMGKEILKDGQLTTSDGRTADDHLVVEDSKKVSTWHLPVRTNGKPDHRLMGAAAAALGPKGYRGEKYSGPNKAEAAHKLVAMYEAEKLEPPSYLIGTKETKRFGDVLTAALHTAYNDTADYYFANGYLTQDERLVVAGAVGPALSALREGLGDTLIAKDVTGIPIPQQLKEYLKECSIQVPDVLIDGQWIGVYKADGDWRWASISSVAIKDLQGETVTTRAMDWLISFNKLLHRMEITKDCGPIRYRHVPGLDGGVCTKQVRVGDFLFETGLFYDTPLGRIMRDKLKEEPDAWRISLGLMFAKDDISADGVYERAIGFERSMTKSPAVPTTSIIYVAKESDMAKLLTEQELKQVAAELGMDEAEVKTMYERAIIAGNNLGFKELEEALKASGGALGGADTGPARKTDEEEREAEKQALKEALESLDDQEWEDMMGVMYDVQATKAKGSKFEVIDDETGDGEDGMMMDEMPKKKKKEEDDTASVILEMMAKQNEHLLMQAKAMEGLATALAGNGRQGVEQAVSDFLSNMPRRQAQSFVTKSAQPNQLPDDASVLAKLKELEAKLAAQQSNRGSGVYEMFTSKQLNQRRGG